MIKPTVGRVVHYIPSIDDPIAKQFDQPLAAIIATVWDDRLVNLTVFDANGVSQGKQAVTLLQDDDPAPKSGSYAIWMPFQKGQAQKTEEIELKLKLDTRAAVKEIEEAAVSSEVTYRGGGIRKFE